MHKVGLEGILDMVDMVDKLDMEDKLDMVDKLDIVDNSNMVDSKGMMNIKQPFCLLWLQGDTSGEGSFGIIIVIVDQTGKKCN